MLRKICVSKTLWLIVLIWPTFLIGCMSSAGLNPLNFLGTSWKEEVLLHDGRIMIVERSVKRGGWHEIGQKGAYTEQSLSFTMPDTGKTVTWEDHFSEELGMANFLPMLLDVHDNAAYLVVSPMGCLSYNKWGRPNPPYVIFKYVGDQWQRISLQELPSEIKTPNLIFSAPDTEVERAKTSYMTKEMISKIVSKYRQPEYKTILREPLEPNGNFGSIVTCEVMIRNERNDGWKGFDISSIHSYSECLDKCKKNKISEQFCPCNNLLKTKAEWR